MTTAEKDYVREKLLDHKTRWEAEARSTLLKEVLAVVDEYEQGCRVLLNEVITTSEVRLAMAGKIDTCTDIRTRLAALNQTENDDE